MNKLYVNKKNVLEAIKRIPKDELKNRSGGWQDLLANVHGEVETIMFDYIGE